MNTTIISKLKTLVEPSLLVDKSLSKQLLGGLNIPSFIRDWFLRDGIDPNDDQSLLRIKEKINAVLPSNQNWNFFLDQLKNGKTIKILTNMTIFFDLKTNLICFELPEQRVQSSQTYIDPKDWETFKSSFLNQSGAVWGVLTLRYESVLIGKKNEYRILLKDFKYFAPYQIDIHHFANLRQHFTITEWLDVLLSGIDFNPDGFESEKQKLTLLQRLLGLVENRVNLIELAPKGTGKTYIFSQLSNKAWWASGGSLTRAKFFYDMTKNTHGLVAFYDLIALDEISSLTFQNENEIQQAFMGYLETGKYTVGQATGQSNCSFILLGNIPFEQMDVSKPMLKTLPSIFNNSALLDRFHGFIQGWNIPRVTEQMKMEGLALSAEYLAETFHVLRNETIYSSLVQQWIKIPLNADTRDTTAIKRITTAFVKLLFPHWRKNENFEPFLFETYCLKPAIEMRKTIKKQMALIDTQFDFHAPFDYGVITL
jgi:ATP-dependent Lon protease